MARPREELHEILCNVIGSRNCYFQPPSNIRMKYPCMRYELARMNPLHADNIPYLNAKAYSLTYIDKDPESEMPERLLQLPYCSFDRAYNADGLHHTVLTLYY